MEKKECEICKKLISKSNIARHISLCINKNQNEDTEEKQEYNKFTQCEFCKKQMLKTSMYKHNKICNFEVKPCDLPKQKCQSKYCKIMVPIDYFDFHKKLCDSDDVEYELIECFPNQLYCEYCQDIIDINKKSIHLNSKSHKEQYHKCDNGLDYTNNNSNYKRYK